jgi:hypothetical protein
VKQARSNTADRRDAPRLYFFDHLKALTEIGLQTTGSGIYSAAYRA